MKKFIKLLVPFILFIFTANSALAAFTDVPPSHENYQAIKYLEGLGIIEGYADGTFRPEQKVVRAEAVKIIIAPLFDTFDDVIENPFPDVSQDQWFAKYVKKAKDEGVISGDGNTGYFESARNVNLAEFLKILTLAYDVDLSSYQYPREIIFADVQDLNQWYIPYLYYAASTNLIHANAANEINPGKDLTRAEVAEITFQLLVNIEGGDTQLYLSMAEAEIIKVLQYLDNNDIDNAEIAVDKAVQYSENAVSITPDSSIVLAANRISHSFKELVNAYRAGINYDYEQVQTSAGLAWELANEAIVLDISVTTLADTIKTIAHDMAEYARTQLNA